MMVDLKKISLVSSGINVLLKPNKVFGMPRHILTEFTNQCNLNCKICPRVNNIPQQIRYFDSEKFKYIIDQINPLVVGIGGLGEPLLTPNAYEMIEYCVQKKIHTYLTTNGTLLKKEYDNIIDSSLRQLSVSIDGYDRDTYKLIRRADVFDQILEGIVLVNHAKNGRKRKHPVLAIHVVVQEDNYRKLSKFIEIAHDLNVGKIFFLQLEQEAHNNNEEFSVNVDKRLLKKELSRAKRLAQKYQINTNISFWENNFLDLCKKYQNRYVYPLSDKICMEPWTTVFITLDGDVLPCCALHSQKSAIGNIYAQDFKTIWNGKRISAFRKEIKHNIKKYYRCKECIPRSVYDIFNDFKRRDFMFSLRKK